MSRHLRLAALASLCVSLAAAPVQAQTDETPDLDAGRFRLGPLRVTPWIAIADIGVDSNVFNEAERPKRDFTTAIGPAVNFWMNLGPSRLRGKTSGQYLFFSKYDGQRSWSTTDEGRWELPLAHFTPFVTGAYASTRQRPSYEIDSRIRQVRRSYGLGTEIRLGSQTTLVLAGTRGDLSLDDEDSLFGASLAQSLDRRTSTEDVQLRRKLTPFTTFVVRAEGIQDRFTHDAVRNADSVRVTGGFELEPLALIAGSGFVGVRSFNPRHDGVPEYRGVVADVKANYTIAHTRVEGRVTRDLDYSFEATQPYYVLTDIGISVTERLSPVWDVVGRTGWQSLSYQRLQGQAAGADRTDRGFVHGVGVGYRVGETLRLGFDVNYFRRDTRATTLADYTGYRVGGSITYGMPQ